MSFTPIAVFAVEQLEQRRLLGVIRLRRITGRRADAAIFFGDQLAVAQGLVGRISPELPADALVQPLGERFGETIGQRLGQDRRVVVVGVLEAIDHGLLADTGGDRESADIVGQSAGARRDEIGKRDVGAAFTAGKLLPQRMQCRNRLHPRFVGEDQNVVAFAVRRPQSEHGAGLEPSFAGDLLEHGLRVVEQAARRVADCGVVEDRRIFAVEFPSGEERRPVDEVDELRDRNVRRP